MNPPLDVRPRDPLCLQSLRLQLLQPRSWFLLCTRLLHCVTSLCITYLGVGRGQGRPCMLSCVTALWAQICTV